MINNENGKLIIFSAPSGAGKTTLVRHLLNRDLSLEFSISACTRPKRAGEEHGKDYYFLTIEDFKQKVENNEFLEYEEVYEGQYYGTLKSELERIWSKGHHVVFDVDVVGGLNIKKQFGDRALAIFVKPPSMKHLEDRLRYRNSETEKNIERRMEKARQEMAYADQFDRILLNDDLNKAVGDAEYMVNRFIGQI